MIVLIKKCHFQAFATPEDAAMHGLDVVENDPDVERVRRAHLNDMENIYLFFTTAFAYVLINPVPAVAISLFGIYTLARYLHTIVYAIYPVRQPARGIMFFIGVLITLFMAIRVIVYFALMI